MTDERLSTALDVARERGEQAIQVAAYVRGELVADAWVGDTGGDDPKPIDGATLFPVQSVTKAFTITSLHLQAERGLVDYDEPVATYWPEFAANGKGGITLRHVLSHRSGLPAPPDVTYERSGDWEWMTAAIAAVQPLFPAGEKGAYQSLVFGYVVGEVVRRTDAAGRRPAQFIQQEICEPLGIQDVWLGVPEEHAQRVVERVGDPVGGRPAGPLTAAAVPPGYVASAAAAPRRYQVENPSGGGVMNARAAARLFAMLANGGELGGTRMLAEERVRSFATPRPVRYELDEVIGFVPVLSQYGFWLGDDTDHATPVMGGPSAFGHPGAGGSTAWADPELGLGAAICHNRMIPSYPPPARGRHPLDPIGDALRAIALDA